MPLQIMWKIMYVSLNSTFECLRIIHINRTKKLILSSPLNNILNVFLSTSDLLYYYARASILHISSKNLIVYLR